MFACQPLWLLYVLAITASHDQYALDGLKLQNLYVAAEPPVFLQPSALPPFLPDRSHNPLLERWKRLTDFNAWPVM